MARDSSPGFCSIGHLITTHLASRFDRRAFRSAPLAPKPATDPASEMGVPAFARPGEAVYATGLRAGVRMRFRAEVTALRVQFPRIVVRYTASEDGTATHPHALPEMRTAYVTMADVAPRDW